MSLFREEILDHYKYPRNFGPFPDATVRKEGDNVPCGDHLEMAVKLNGGVLEETRFQGEGCALSIAAASMLTELVKGNTPDYVRKISDEDMTKTVLNGEVSSGRLPCILLGLHTLKGALREAAGSAKIANGVTKDMNLGEIATRWPQARAVLLDYGLHCVGCFASSFDTIEAGAKVHGMSEEEIFQMIGEINNTIQRSSREKGV